MLGMLILTAVQGFFNVGYDDDVKRYVAFVVFNSVVVIIILFILHHTQVKPGSVIF